MKIKLRKKLQQNKPVNGGVHHREINDELICKIISDFIPNLSFQIFNFDYDCDLITTNRLSIFLLILCN